jgi:hypothetical protein
VLRRYELSLFEAINLGIDRVLSMLPEAFPGSRELRRQRRASRGQCIHCGYDLTGNMSGVCPECGIPLYR